MKPGDEQYTIIYQALMALEQSARRIPEHFNIARRYLAAGRYGDAAETLQEVNTALQRLYSANQTHSGLLIAQQAQADAEEQAKEQGANSGE